MQVSSQSARSAWLLDWIENGEHVISYMGEGRHELWCQMSSRSHDTGPGNQGTSASLDVLSCRGLNDEEEMLPLLTML